MVTKRFRWHLWMAATAALLFNNWLLGLWLNHRLLAAGGSVSELSVAGQPYHWVFRILDIVSGLLVILLAWLYYHKSQHSKAVLWVVLAMVLLGLGNIIDALAPLPCSGTLNSACSADVNLSLNHFSVPGHAYSSSVIGIAYLLLPIAGFIESHRTRNRLLQLTSLVVIAATLIFFGLLLNESLKGRYVGSSAAGFSQVAQMLLLGLWLVVYFVGRPVVENKRAKV